MSLGYEKSEPISARQRWMAVLANASFSDLSTYWQPLQLDPGCEVIRPPEVGLARLQGRIGGGGDRFNVGDTTITRATIRLQDGTLGYGYLRGRAKQHALLAAVIDALLQQVSYTTLLQEKLIDPLLQLQINAMKEKTQQAAKSKVDFFTVLRGED